MLFITKRSKGNDQIAFPQNQGKSYSQSGDPMICDLSIIETDLFFFLLQNWSQAYPALVSIGSLLVIFSKSSSSTAWGKHDA